MSWRKVFRSRKFSSKEVSAYNAVDGENFDGESVDGNDWSTILPELLREIIRRIDADEEQWPHRQNVVACAGVCKRWRDMTREIVRSHSHNDIITFPSCLKQPGPCELPHQCLIKRDKKTSTFYLYLALTQSFKDKGKFLLAARRYKFGTYTRDVISLDADDFSQGSNAYVGKLSSDFLGTNFTIYDSQPPHSGVKPPSGKASRRSASKKISPQVPAGNFVVGHVAYKFNRMKSRGPRRMICSLKSPISSKGESSDIKSLDGHKMHSIDLPASGYTMFKNKAPRWHENFQGWVLSFHGRVKIASVKNFQLVATGDQSQPGGKGDEETVLLQFGKVGDDTFTMDYREPLSAFQAFAICLSSFGTKQADFAWGAPSP